MEAWEAWPCACEVPLAPWACRPDPVLSLLLAPLLRVVVEVEGAVGAVAAVGREAPRVGGRMRPEGPAGAGGCRRAGPAEALLRMRAAAGLRPPALAFAPEALLLLLPDVP